MLGNSAVVVVVERTRPRAIPLAKITMRKSTLGFLLSFPCMMSMGLRLAALWAAGAQLLVLHVWMDYDFFRPLPGLGYDSKLSLHPSPKKINILSVWHL